MSNVVTVFNTHPPSSCVCQSGGILVFLTGQVEVNTLCRKLRKAFPFRKGNTNTGKYKTPFPPSHIDKWIFIDYLCICVQVRMRKPTPQRQ